MLMLVLLPLMLLYLHPGFCCILGCYGDRQLCVFVVQPVDLVRRSWASLGSQQSVSTGPAGGLVEPYWG